MSSNCFRARAVLKTIIALLLPAPFDERLAWQVFIVVGILLLNAVLYLFFFQDAVGSIIFRFGRKIIFIHDFFFLNYN